MRVFINGKPEEEHISSQVLSANGAITIKNGIVFITKTGACAATLADPISGTDDNKRLVIVSVTDFGHTISNAGGSGFNGAGAGGDVFGVAAGSGRMAVIIRAYAGKWYLESYDLNASLT